MINYDYCYLITSSSNWLYRVAVNMDLLNKRSARMWPFQQHKLAVSKTIVHEDMHDFPNYLSEGHCAEYLWLDISVRFAARLPSLDVVDRQLFYSRLVTNSYK